MYGKHFESMYTGSMCGAGALAFAVWGYVISHQRPSSDRSIFAVEMNPKILATVIGETEKDIAEQIAEFCGPDPASRSQDEEGRKLVQLSPYMYRVVNGAHYDKIRKEDERREYNRERQRMLRAGDPKQQQLLTEPKSKNPTLEEVKLVAAKAGLPELEAVKLFNHYESNGWKVGRNPMKSLPHAVANWRDNWKEGTYGNGSKANRGSGGKRTDLNAGTSNDGKGHQYKNAAVKPVSNVQRPGVGNDAGGSTGVSDGAQQWAG